MRRRIAAILLSLILLTSCVSHGGKIREWFNAPGVEAIVLSYDIASAQRFWIPEVAPEYPNALLVIAHGDSWDGRWYAYPTHGLPVLVEELVRSIRETYPHRRIVLIICNPEAHTLDVPGVSYAPDKVWVMTDKKAGLSFRDLLAPEAVGSFEEFIHLE